ncbi:SH3 domain-containing protein [Leptospira idonii]|uniref:SH3 domain-containing protein n=1 Tax=Leptospira idonii TaxID=1193500 RepID=A0A4R9M0G6_9LEPT|nr:SH3 domain-containing protein [Leptospira idonii]TGN19147.1 SH3 domain-containing protein [Leptospira idonii]
MKPKFLFSIPNLLICLFVFSPELLLSETKKASDSPYAISGDQVRVRKTPSLKGEVLQTLSKGETVRVIACDRSLKETVKQKDGTEKKGFWIQIETNENKQGYIFSEYIGYNMIKSDSPSYIVSAETKSQDELYIIGYSAEGVLESNLDFHNKENYNPQKFPKKKLNLYGFYGETVGIFENAAFQGIEHESYEEDLVKGNRNIFPGKPKAIIGRTVGSYGKAKQVKIDRKIGQKLLEDLIADNNLRNKTEKLDPKKIPLLTASFCKDKCDFYLVKNEAKNFEILISDMRSETKSDVMENFNRIFRIDKITNGKITNLYLHRSTSPEEDSARLLAITDIDGDDKLEVWVHFSGYEWWYYGLILVEEHFALPLYSGSGGGV